MFRAILYLLITVFLITVVRSIMGVVLKGFSEMLRGAVVPEQQPSSSGANTVPLGGELKRDPVCGTFTSTATALREQIKGQTIYFCSPECRAKYLGAARG